MYNQTIKLITIVFVLTFNSIYTFSTYAQSKDKFIKSKVPKDRDFTKIDPNVRFRHGHLLVRFAAKPGDVQRSKAEKTQILNDLCGASIIREYKIISGLTLVKLSSGQTVEESLEIYNARNDILYAEPDYELKLLSTFPDDTRFDELWGMHNTGQTGGTVDADIDAPEAWDIATDACDVIVAVIDTGIDYNHPDLSDNIWLNEAEVNGTSGIDDDGNGYIDDIYGWDFFAEDNEPMDYFGHGTHVAGTIGAVGNNGTGVVGVCWNVKLMALQVTHYDQEGWDIWASNAIEAINYAINNGADVLNNSWGGFTDIQALRDAVENSKDAGVLFIAAAGNESIGTPRYPALYDFDNIISVLATDHNDTKSSFSNYGLESVDLGAPGSDILSCVLGDAYESHSGTSMACPHVAGACALVWGVNPNLSHLAVKQIILDNVDQLNSLDGLCVTGGRLNLYKAVLNARALSLGIEDDVADGVCLDPCDLVEYTITYGNPVFDPCGSGYLGDVDDVYIIDYLPDGFTYISADPCNNGFYNAEDRYFYWNIGTLEAGAGGDPCDPCFVTITLQVNSLAEPNGVITNEVIINNADNEFFNCVTESTLLCCWNYGVIYVNRYATGENTGVNWENAYTDLQHAMMMGRACFRDEIWVANGIYKPTYDPDNSDATFELVPDVKLLGGFGGWETSSNQRKPQKYKTYLTGDIDGDGDSDIDNVVSGFNAGTDTLIDGFIIGKSKNAALYIEDAPPLIERNTIRENDEYGIYFEAAGQSYVKNCWIHNNGDHGIYYHNTANGGFVRNCSIVSNAGQGIYNDGGDDPNVANCILWQNNSEGLQFTDCEVTYSCYINPGDPNEYGPLPPDYNIRRDPCFIFDEFDDPNTYTCYLDLNSLCIDLGDPCLDYTGEYDINGDDRVMYGRVDMGADEFNHPYCGSSLADFDADGIVGLADFARLSDAWLTDPLDQNWDPCCDLDYDDEIAVGDMLYLSEDWLLMLCSLLEQRYMENGPGTGMPPCPLYGGTGQLQLFSSSTADHSVVLPPPELTIEELIELLKDILIVVDEMWQTRREELIKEISEEEWFEFIDALNKELERLTEQLD